MDSGFSAVRPAASALPCRRDGEGTVTQVGMAGPGPRGCEAAGAAVAESWSRPWAPRGHWPPLPAAVQTEPDPVPRRPLCGSSRPVPRGCAPVAFGRPALRHHGGRCGATMSLPPACALGGPGGVVAPSVPCCDESGRHWETPPARLLLCDRGVIHTRVFTSRSPKGTALGTGTLSRDGWVSGEAPRHAGGVHSAGRGPVPCRELRAWTAEAPQQPVRSPERSR